MSQMYYKDSNGVLVPMGTPGPQGPQGEPGAPDFPTADARYVKKAGDTMSGQLVIYANNLQVEEDSGPASFWIITHEGHPYINVASKNSDDHYETHRFGPTDVTAFAIRTAPNFIAFMGGNDSGDIWAADAVSPLHMTRQGVLTMGRKTVPNDGEMAVPHKGYVDNQPWITWRTGGIQGGDTWNQLSGTKLQGSGITLDGSGNMLVDRPGRYLLTVQLDLDSNGRGVVSYGSDADGGNWSASTNWLFDTGSPPLATNLLQSGSRIVNINSTLQVYAFLSNVAASVEIQVSAL